MPNGAGEGVSSSETPENHFETSIETVSDSKGFCQNLSIEDTKPPLRCGARWPYDSRRIQKRIAEGKYRINEDLALRNYFEWLSLDYELTFTNDDQEKSFSKISPKRGNRQYALKKWQAMKRINDCMKGMDLDMDIPHHRSIHRRTHFLLITLTFSQNITKEQAWHNITANGQELNRFKANLSKIFGSKATIMVKEAQANGYPAPHILVVLDRPARYIDIPERTTEPRGGCHRRNSCSGSRTLGNGVFRCRSGHQIRYREIQRLWISGELSLEISREEL